MCVKCLGAVNHRPKFRGFQRGVFVRGGGNLNNWGGCAHRLQ